MKLSQQDNLPSPLYRWFLVLTLSAAMAFSLVDRFVLSLLFEPIKADLLLSDTQLGMLHGIAFGLFYATVGIPIAWLIDRWSRKWVIFWGIACWSLMTVLCGLSRSFTQLLGARIGVAVGEAALAPAGYSLIADAVPKQQLATAISIFQMGSLFGGGLAFLAGGKILSMVEVADFSDIVLLAGLAPWQLTFIIVALPAVVFLPLVLLIREPRRSGLISIPVSLKKVAKPGLLKVLRKNRALYLSLFVGNSCLISISYGNMTWIPSVLVRQFDWTLAEIGFRFGLVMLTMAPAGVLLGGVLADRWNTTGRSNAYPRVLIFSAMLATFFVLLATLAHSAWTLFIIIGVVQFVVSMAIGTGPAVIIKTAPTNVRAQLSAVYIFMVNFVGLGVGPIMVGLFSDHLFTSNDGILDSLRVFSILMCLVSMLSLWIFQKKAKHEW